MSSLTEVETGTEMLLLAAWHVRMVCRSPLLRLGSRSSLVTLPSLTSSERLSSRAWSRHQLTFGLGWPERKMHIYWARTIVGW